MAPSSTPSAASASDERLRGELLAARDARQALLDRLLAGGAPALVMLSLAIPGPEKRPPGAAPLFAWAAARIPETLPGARECHRGEDPLGPFAIWATPHDPREAKLRCTLLEASRPAARLLDLDVYSPSRGAIDRASLLLPPRPCLCCPAPARECIRLGRHGPAALAAHARALLLGP